MFTEELLPFLGPGQGVGWEGIAPAQVSVGEVEFIGTICDGGAGNRCLPDGVMAYQPASHITAIGPAGDGDAAFINNPFGLDRFESGHDIPARSVAGVVEDGALIGVPEVVAAAIVR